VSNIVTEFIALIAANSAIVFIVKNWFLERLRHSIKSEYDAKLETLKSQLALDNSAYLEGLKSSAAKDLEKLRHDLQARIEEYRVSASSPTGAMLNLSASIERMAQCCSGIHDYYCETLLIDDEPRLERLYKCLSKAHEDLDHAVLILDKALETDIKNLLQGYGFEISSFGSCVAVKKVRSGLIDPDCAPDEYDFSKARRVAKDLVPQLEADWRELKERLRIFVSHIGEQ
jgi:hypothetical protein